MVRDPIKQAYSAQEAGINASRTIGYFLEVVVVIIFISIIRHSQ